MRSGVGRAGEGDWRARMRLRTGQVAPSFQAIDIYGRRVALSHYRGTNLLLSFNRAAVCPLCNIRTWHLINRYGMYQRLGMQIIAFYESSPGRSHSYLDRLEAPFPIIADLERNIYSLYGLESSWLGAVNARLTRWGRSEEHTSELQSHSDLVCRLLLE